MAPAAEPADCTPLVQTQTEEEICAQQQESFVGKRGLFVSGAIFGVGAAIGAACVAPMLSEGTHRASLGSLIGLTVVTEASPACAADGGACLDSGCCLPGGQKGLQCFKKNENYAECSASCEPGVHEPEKEGSWDASGTFQKAQWTCEPLGQASEPGCEAFTGKSGSECPTDYCMSKGEACMPRCDLVSSEDGCWKSKDCMWNKKTDKCMEACWSLGTADTCAPTDTCWWSGKQCQIGSWNFFTPDTCAADLGYKWNGSCVLDECSMIGEDCTNTKCCSTERGAGGATCFKKNKYWATCQETCQPHGNWSCEALGKRAKYAAGCAWAGKDCKVDKLCCNRGFTCAVKDKDFTGCVLTKATSTWVAQNVAIPSNWEGTYVGAGRDEFEFQQAGPEDAKIGTTLYCFMAYLPGTYEEELISLAEKNGASIYGCDKHDLFHTWQSGSAGWDTGESTLVNTDVFYKVFQQAFERGDILKYDWTVKVDPDCVFAPDRLRSHIQSYNLPNWAAVYIKNNGQDPGLGNNGFLGAIEIFSRKAMMIFQDNGQGCIDAMGVNMGEDGFMKGCMDGLGIGYVKDVDIFFPDNGAGACRNQARVAFHPLKDPTKWQHCWDILLGKSEW